MVSTRSHPHAYVVSEDDVSTEEMSDYESDENEGDYESEDGEDDEDDNGNKILRMHVGGPELARMIVVAIAIIAYIIKAVLDT